MSAILAALEPTGDELVLLASIKNRVPGGFWARLQALTKLHYAGRVYFIQIGGRPYVGLGTKDDLEMVAKARREGRVRDIRSI